MAQFDSVPLCGFALTLDRGIISTKESFNEELRRGIHTYLSPSFCDALTGNANMNVPDCPVPGSTVALAGRSAMPCVCEAPANAITASNVTKMVVEGITWQSLYLAFFGSYLVLAEPAPGRYVHSPLCLCVVDVVDLNLSPNLCAPFILYAGRGKVVW